MTRSPDQRRTTGARPNQSGEVGPQNAKAHELVAMAHALCDEGRAREAEDMARWALSQAPQLAPGHTVLARARFEQGHLREAQSLLEVVVQRNPSYFVAHRWLAEVLITGGDFARAADVLVRAEALSPGDPRIAQLVQHVMAGPQGRPSAVNPATVPPPPVAPGLLQAGERKRTYEEPVPAEVEPMTIPPGRPTAALVRSSSAQIAATRLGGRTNTRSDRPPLPRPGRVRPLLRRLSPAPALAWLRTHGRYLALAMGALGLFAFTVWGVSWFLKQPAGEGVTARRSLSGERAGGALLPVTAGSFAELTGIRAKERRRQLRQEGEPTGRGLLAESLLATEYGRPLDPDSEIWADELAEQEGGLGGPDELLAARVLDRMVRGDRKAAAELARSRGLASSDSPLLRFVEGRRLAREGNQPAALARVGEEAARSPFLPLRLLRAELLLDDANPKAAEPLIRSVLQASPGHPGALRLLIELRDAQGTQLSAAEKAELASACSGGDRRIPTLATTCRLATAGELRRAGKREPAFKLALRTAHASPEDPRLYARIAQLLGNLGAAEEANDLVARAEQFADRRYSPIAWARAGIGLGRDRGTQLPAGPPPGSEARLIAARAAFIGPASRRRSISALGVTPLQARADGDLRWVADGSEARGARAAAAMARKADSDYGARPPSAVASYVVGTLARRGGEGPVARRWLSHSLEGHGDVCRSTSLYVLSLRDGGNDPRSNVKLQRAIGRLGCERPLEALQQSP